MRRATPGFIPPMLPTLSDTAPSGSKWQHEIRYDGYRTLVAVDGGSARAFTRNDLDWSAKYAPIVAAASRLECSSTILDGEMIVQDAEGRSDYAALRKAIGREPNRLVFYAFDILKLDSLDLRPLPLHERRVRLAQLIPLDASNPLQRTTHFDGDGPAVFAAADKSGLEGIVSKLRDSRYASGRTDSWLKIKCFKVETLEIIGVKIADNGAPYAIMARDGEDVGEALVSLPMAERAAFWDVVEMLETPRARLAPFLKRRHKAKWLKAGLSARVRSLKDEEKMRHAKIVGLIGDVGGGRRRSDKLLVDKLPK